MLNETIKFQRRKNGVPFVFVLTEKKNKQNTKYFFINTHQSLSILCRPSK